MLYYIYMGNKAQTSKATIKGKNDKIMAILAYIIFFLPIILVKNRSAFLNFHINQGLSLFIVALLGAIVFRVIPFLAVFHPLLSLVIILLVIIGILNVVHGRMKELPFFGHILESVK